MGSARLRTRLVASFVAVALAGIATLAALVIVSLPGRLSGLVVERQDLAAERAGRVLARGYQRGGWADGTLLRAGAIVGEMGGSVELTTHPRDGGPSPPPSGSPSGGTPTASSTGGGGPSGGSSPSVGPSGSGPSAGPSDAGPTGGGSTDATPSPDGGPGTPPRSGSGGRGAGGGGTGGEVAAASRGELDSRTIEVPVVVDGRTVGILTVRYPSGVLPAPEQALATSLRWSVLLASLVGVLVALGVALFAARRLDRPIARLTTAARRLANGDLTARAASDGAPGEIGELAETFDQMADSLAREDEVRRVIVADVAHELRTPVTILQASLEELVDGTVEPETDRLSSLHDEVLRLAKILQDLEALAAAQAAGLEMSPQEVDLADVAGTALTRLEGSFAAADVEPHAELAPVRVLGDPDRLDQVVTNLLTNAMKYTPPGGDVRVTVAALNGDARLEVEDTGAGIPEDELPHVFERFWRGSAARTTSGSGVGLAVVAELVRAHHGRVEVSSPPGKGAAFRVILPRA